MSRHRLAALALLLAGFLTRSAAAQDVDGATTTAPPHAPPGPRHALSLNPLGALGSGYLAGEYEARLTARVSAGVGAGTMTGTPAHEEAVAATTVGRLVHGDLFARWHLTGTVFAGTSLGIRLGLSRLPGERTFPGAGLDLHRSWTFSRHVVGNLGWGMKRVFGGQGTAFDQRYVPWVKAHIGVAF